jgi:two-component system NtrC family sensor kinase
MIDLTQVPPPLFSCALEANLRRIATIPKLYNHFLDAVMARLGADCAWAVRHSEGTGGWHIVRGDAGLLDGSLVAAYDRLERPEIPRGTLLAPLSFRGRHFATLGAARKGRGFEGGARRNLERLGEILAIELFHREEERLSRVLDRIRAKILAQLRPQDVAYQILDGLHQLVDYDHSSALLTYSPERGSLRVEAEKVVWTKAKSSFVGLEIAVTPAQADELSRELAVRRLEMTPVTDPVRALLDYHRGQQIPPVASLLVAPLFIGGRFLGLLKIAAARRAPFDFSDRAVVERFLPVAAVSLRNAQVNRSLENQAVQAELKASLVTLARAVAHDVNNAVGSILPLVQQMREDLKGEIDREDFDRDLEMIEENARFCRRIFSNMLKIGGGGRTASGPIDLNQTVLETLPFLEGQATRRGVELALELGSDLPCVHFSRQDLQHILVNLVSNSLEAVGEGGGRITVATARDGGGAPILSVVDDGPGIDPRTLAKIHEPFFTTKPGGTGLGLAICRSLAWQNGGRLNLESDPGRGTRATVQLRADPSRRDLVKVAV